MAGTGLNATFIDATCFTVALDRTLTFVVGRRVKADCGVDGYKFGTIASSVFDGTNSTTVCLTSTSDDLTSNLDVVWYGIVGGGAYDQSIPVHSHDGSEGSGGLVDTGCCTSVYYEGTEVDGSPFDNVNFIGDNISIDSTSEVANAVDVQVIFGQEYDYGSSDAQSDTSASTPQQKLRLTTASLPSGTYHIEWQYEFNVDSNKDSDFNAQVQINDTTTIAAQGDNAAWKLDTVWVAQSGFYDAVLSGVLNIDIDYWDSAGVGVSIRRARIVIWRVA
jgi:hypothetical protein